MSAHEQGVDVFDAAIQLHGDERAETGDVEHAGLTDDAVGGEPARLVGGVHHRVERVRDNDQDAVRAVGHNVLGDFSDNSCVCLEQLIAAHAGPSRDTGGDDGHIAVGGLLIGSCPDDVGVESFDGPALEQVERLALGKILLLRDIDQDDVAQFLFRGPLGTCCADIAGADHGYPVASHTSASKEADSTRNLA